MGRTCKMPIWRVRLAAQDAALSRQRSRVQIPYAPPDLTGQFHESDSVTNEASTLKTRGIAAIVGSLLFISVVVIAILLSFYHYRIESEFVYRDLEQKEGLAA